MDHGVQRRELHVRVEETDNAKSTKSVASVGYTVATVKYPLAWVSAKKR